MITQTLDYSDGDTELEGYLAFQETDVQKPLVLVSHDWSGRRDFACKAAERMAELG
jgi:dienelactone hydrolase